MAKGVDKIGLDLTGAVQNLVKKKVGHKSIGFAATGRDKGFMARLVSKFGDSIWEGVGGTDVERGSRY